MNDRCKICDKLISQLRAKMFPRAATCGEIKCSEENRRRHQKRNQRAWRTRRAELDPAWKAKENGKSIRRYYQKREEEKTTQERKRGRAG